MVRWSGLFLYKKDALREKVVDGVVVKVVGAWKNFLLSVVSRRAGGKAWLSHWIPAGGARVFWRRGKHIDLFEVRPPVGI